MKGGSSRRKILKSYTGNLGGARNPIKSDECSEITFTIRLSRVTDSIKSLKVHAELRLQRDGDSIVAKNTRGSVCGYIASAHNSDILACMRKGRIFIAVVLEVDESLCRVRVQISS